MKPKDFVKRSNLRGALAISRDWLAIAALIAVSIKANHIVIYLISIWLIGSFQFALSEALLHEASHYNLFKTRKLNDWLEFFYGLPCLRTVEQLRLEHTVHHQFLGQPEDHIFGDYEAFGLYRSNLNLRWVWFIRPVLGYAGYYYARTLTLKPWRSGLKIGLFWTVVLPVFIYFDWLHLLVLYWLIPLFWSCYSHLYWSEITDHFRTRTGIRSNLGWFNNFMHHNNGYHFTHHTYASIPWYMLPAATRALCPDEGDVSHGFIGIYRSIKSGPTSPLQMKPSPEAEGTAPSC